MSGDAGRPIIRGERVFLRAAERSDIPLFVGWLNDAETASFVTMRSPMSVPLEEGWFERMLAVQGKDGYHFVLCLLEGARPIGTVGLFDLDHANGSAGVGIVIGDKGLWGQGYGTDAINALVDFGSGELRLERIWLEVYDYNPRGRRSYEKCGFTLEGVERRAAYRHGAYHDVELMSILRDEWAAFQRRRSWELGA
jgi:diamine N-acetyltransferase